MSDTYVRRRRLLRCAAFVAVVAMMVSSGTAIANGAVTLQSVSGGPQSYAEMGGARVDGNRVVWGAADAGKVWQTYLWDAATNMKAAISPGGGGVQSVKGNLVAYSRYDSAIQGRMVFVYNIATKATIQLTQYDSAVNDMDARRVVYSSRGSGGINDWEIYVWDSLSGQTQQITSNAYPDDGAQLDGDRVTWMAWPAGAGGKTQIHTRLLTASSNGALTTNSTVDHEPMRAGAGRVVWQEWDPGALGEAQTRTVVGNPSTNAQTTIANNLNYGTAGNYPVMIRDGCLLYLGQIDGEGGSHVSDTRVYNLTSGSTAHLPRTATFGGAVWELGQGGSTRLYGGKVWARCESQTNSKQDVFSWDYTTGALERVTEYNFSDISVVEVQNGRLVVKASNDGGNTYEIYTAIVGPVITEPTQPLSTSVSKPSISPSKPKKGKSATFTATLTPGAAMNAVTAKLYAAQKLTKTVTKKVGGKKKRVKVTYWKTRKTVTMAKSPSGSSARLSAKAKLSYKGSWKAWVVCTGSSGYGGCTSVAKTFTVK